jgi:hypothetical protein
MADLLLIGAGSFGVVIFAFLSWRALGGSQRNPDAHDLAAGGPTLFRWCARACAVTVVVGVVRLFVT